MDPRLSPWLDLKVFYVRVSNCEADESIPNRLTVNHIPLAPDADLEVSGRRISSTRADSVVSTLRRDRIDKRSEEATFVSTEGMKISGGVRFEIYDGRDLLLVGVLESSNGNRCRRWSMKCHGVVNSNAGFSRGKITLPTVEVYVTGCFGGAPIILTKAVRLGNRRKHRQQTISSGDASSRVSEYRCYEPETDAEIDCSGMYSRPEFVEGEDGEVSWFNAGVRVGVGIALGVCLGIGIGAGLLVRSYQATARNFKRRLR